MEAQTDRGGNRPTESEIAALYGAFSERLRRFALALTRDREGSHDCVQETFARYLEVSRAGSVIPNPQAWMFSVIRNLAVDRIRAAREVTAPPYSVPAHSEGRAWQELQSALETVLTARELECVRLRAQGLTHAEVARELGIKGGTVASLLWRASRKARKAGILPGEKAAARR